MPLLAHVFEEDGAVDQLEAFTSLNGAAFYGLPPNPGHITLTRHSAPQTFPDKILTEAGPVTVFNPGFPIYWHADT